MIVCDYCGVQCVPIKTNTGSMKIDACCLSHKKMMYLRFKMIKKIEAGEIEKMTVATIKKHGFKITVEKL
jgi:hypothetical protein